MEPEGPLEDDHGRTVTGLRMSLTDRCNLDCFYCHNEGLGDTRGPREPRGNEISATQAVEIAEVAHGFGVDEFKLTGGEPMLRDDLEDVVEGVAALHDVEVSMTTNGVYLADRAEELSRRGLDRVNVSMDAPDAEAFREITRGGVDRVYEGIAAAVAADLTPVKVNTVMTEQTRPHLEDMLDYVCGLEGVSLQAVEYMPELVGDDVGVDIDEVKQKLARQASEVVTRDMHHRDRYVIEGTEVEVVDPVGNPEFCANCHRVRVTPTGELKGCLNRDDDLRSVAGLPRSEIQERFRETVSERVPYYGEYLVEDDEGNWVENPERRRDPEPEPGATALHTD